MKKIIAAISLTLLLTPFSAMAQDGNRVVLTEKQVAQIGSKMTDFVPQGWKLLNEVRGRLKADSVEDVVLQLMEDKPDENAKGEFQDRYLALVIVSKAPDGRYHRAAVAGKLIQCTGCGGVLGGPGGADLKIVKGVLLVSQLSGSREATDHLWRIRYDARTGRFLLIGEDINQYDRVTGSSVVTSINYLTGQQVVESKQFNEKLDKYVTQGKPKKTPVGKKQITIEEIDYEK